MTRPAQHSRTIVSTLFVCSARQVKIDAEDFLRWSTVVVRTISVDDVARWVRVAGVTYPYTVVFSEYQELGCAVCNEGRQILVTDAVTCCWFLSRRFKTNWARAIFKLNF